MRTPLFLGCAMITNAITPLLDGQVTVVIVFTVIFLLWDFADLIIKIHLKK